jgi:hypothetical protein
MSDVPPIPSPPVAPQPLPTAVNEQLLQKYITWSELICIGAASVGLVGVIWLLTLHFQEGRGNLIQYLQEGANFAEFGLASWYLVMGSWAAVLLHLRRREAYLVTMTHLIFMLVIVFPVTTIFGFLGLLWLNAGRDVLRRV